MKNFVPFYCLKIVKGYFFIMKLVFASNYFNHHQKPICERLYSHLGEDFVFLATKPMREERKKLGYDTEELPDYVVCAYDMEKNRKKAMELIDMADVVIIGSAPWDLMKNRIKTGKIIVKYTERPLKEGLNLIKYLPRLIKWHSQMPQNKPIYLLCASAYTLGDYSRFFLFKNRAYKWGYFPKVNLCDETVIDSKEENTILWCGRFLDWKHPDDVLLMADSLKKQGISFRLKFIGTGEMEKKLKAQAKALALIDIVEFSGSMPPDEVRKNMEKSQIFIATSDFREGWGAVINEAMASGCAVVASHAMGSVPFLIKDGENGFIYKSGNVVELTQKVKKLLKDKNLSRKIGKSAFVTANNEWNPDVAADRLYELCKGLVRGESVVYSEGPCSHAKVIFNNWIDKM